MNDEQNKPNKLIDTTDCLEAVDVFRGWKNFLFVLTILCLSLLQICFWLVNTGYVKPDEGTKSSTAAVTAEETKQIEKAARQVIIGPNEPIQEAAKQVAAEPAPPAPAAPQEQKPIFQFKPTINHLIWLIQFCNFVLIPTAALYCLTLMFGLKVSLLGRLGGINHITRAFFLSLLTLVLILPWQRFFGGVIAGAMYMPDELISRCSSAKAGKLIDTIFFYLRFSGYWLLVVLLLILSFIRSMRWAKAMLRRLEVI